MYQKGKNCTICREGHPLVIPRLLRQNSEPLFGIIQYDRHYRLVELSSPKWLLGNTSVGQDIVQCTHVVELQKEGRQMRSAGHHDPKTTIVLMRIQTDTVEQPVILLSPWGANWICVDCWPFGFKSVDPTITTRLVWKRVPCASKLMKKHCQRHCRPRCWMLNQ